MAVQEFGDRVTFVNENFGEPGLAERFGIKRYPAVFVNDVLVAKPKDFGFYGDGGSQGEGRYTPWRKAESHERFRQDVVRMIKLALRGDDDQLQAQGVQADQAEQLAALPAFSLTDLDGRALSREELDGRVVVVEFWASWCPPCLGTIGWLGELGERHGDRIGVLAFAVESPEPEVRELVESTGGDVRWALGTPELASAFGDVVAVPTLFVFDREGKTASTFYGNPPDLYARVEALVTSLLE